MLLVIWTLYDTLTLQSMLVSKHKVYVKKHNNKIVFFDQEE